MELLSAHKIVKVKKHYSGAFQKAARLSTFQQVNFRFKNSIWKVDNL